MPGKRWLLPGIPGLTDRFGLRPLALGLGLGPTFLYQFTRQTI